MLGQAGYAGNREDALLEAIIGRRPDGIVLTGIMHSAEGRGGCWRRASRWSRPGT
jgi:LacI family gluconate utilization system Gnt-I transcriptional repressor